MAQKKITGEQIDQSTLDADLFLPDQTGNAGEVLTTDGTNISWAPGGGGTPAGADTQIQFNNSGSFGADSAFTWDATTDTLQIGALAITTNSITATDVTDGLNIVFPDNFTTVAGAGFTMQAANTFSADSTGGDVSISSGASLTVGGTGKDGDLSLIVPQVRGGGVLSLSNGSFVIALTNTALEINSDPGTSGQVLTSAGAGSPPTWSTPGGGMTWNNVTGTSATMVGGEGYLANNAGLVTLTLPASPTLADVVEVVGVGAGGYEIAQNAGQSIKFTNLVPVPATPFDAVAPGFSIFGNARAYVSDTGQRMLSASFGGLDYSSDFGATWAPLTLSGETNETVMDGSGLILMNITTGGLEFRKSTDGGVNWTTTTPFAGSLQTIRMSRNGQVAVVQRSSPAQPYITTDGGATWSVASGVVGAASFSLSYDGQVIICGSGTDKSISTDYGATWTTLSGLPLDFVSVVFDGTAISADGQTIVLIGDPQSWGPTVIISTDQGVTWRMCNQNLPESGMLSAMFSAPMAINEDGSRIFLGDQLTGAISQDYGVTFDRIPGISTADAPRAYGCNLAGDVVLTAGATASDFVNVSTDFLKPVTSTTVGTAGKISGGANTSIELQFVGSNTWVVKDFQGDFTTV